MNRNDRLLDEPVPGYLERYAAEVDQWRREALAARARRAARHELTVHPKDRALFAHIASVLGN